MPAGLSNPQAEQSVGVEVSIAKVDNEKKSGISRRNYTMADPSRSFQKRYVDFLLLQFHYAHFFIRVNLRKNPKIY
jgi:hypothetical protein